MTPHPKTPLGYSPQEAREVVCHLRESTRQPSFEKQLELFCKPQNSTAESKEHALHCFSTKWVIVSSPSGLTSLSGKLPEGDQSCVKGSDVISCSLQQEDSNCKSYCYPMKQLRLLSTEWRTSVHSEREATELCFTPTLTWSSVNSCLSIRYDF